MEDKQKIKLMKDRIRSNFNGVAKVTTKVNSKGKISFTYEMVKELTTYPEDINVIIKDGIESSKANIRFLKSLQSK